MSHTAFASLTPANALARLAFSDLVDVLTAGRQDDRQDGLADAKRAALRRLSVPRGQTHERDVLRLRLADGRRAAQQNDASSEGGEAPPDADDDADDDGHADPELHRGLDLASTGCYLLSLDMPPVVPERGWTIGKGPLDNQTIELVLCTCAFAHAHHISLRNPHARLNFSPTDRSFYISGGSHAPSAQVLVNDAPVIRKHTFLQSPSIIQLDKLQYVFQWTSFAATDDFRRACRRYVTGSLRGPQFPDIDMPTPPPIQRSVGSWTLGEALNPSGLGRVFASRDDAGNTAAVKAVERTTGSFKAIDEEVEALQQVTAFANRLGSDGNRLLRMADVLYSDCPRFSEIVGFDNVSMVFQPLTPRTMTHLIPRPDPSLCKGLPEDTALAFRDALRSVKVLHDNHWIHRDLKPRNIGIVDGEPMRTVLLGLGAARHVAAGQCLPPKPGRVGTIAYLAPEMERQDYDNAVDIWAMGVILFQLTYGYHPWKFTSNPWRDDKADSKNLRLAFQDKYQTATELMAADAAAARSSPIERYIHLGDLFVAMVRYTVEDNDDSERRPNIDEVLQHPAWGALTTST